jgi:hypothetical protein
MSLQKKQHVHPKKMKVNLWLSYEPKREKTRDKNSFLIKNRRAFMTSRPLARGLSNNWAGREPAQAELSVFAEFVII